MTEDRRQIADMSAVGVFCEVCHRWNEGRSDVCRHCHGHLIGSRPLRARSVDSWLENQGNEYTALGIPFTVKTRNVLRQWASLNPADLSTLRHNDDAEETRPDHSTPRLLDDSEPACTPTVPNPDQVRQLMAVHDLTWHEAWKLSGRPYDDDDLARAHRKSTSLRPWRIAAAVSGGGLLTMLVLLELMWRSTAGDVAARNALGVISLLFAPPLLLLFVATEVSLIGLGVNTKLSVERVVSWSGAALLIVWLGWSP